VNNELLWLSAVGLTDQFIHDRIDTATYTADVERHHHLVLARNADDASETATTTHVDEATGEMVQVSVTGGRTVTRLVVENELRFLLYRHWSLYDAMLHSVYVASRVSTWAERGETRLKQLFASMGIPLAQLRQKWAYMDERIKRELPAKLAEWAPQIGLTDYTYGSIVKVTAYRTQIAAADVVCAVSALLESCGTASDSGAADENDAPPVDENDAGNAAAADAAADAAYADAAAKAAAASWERSFWRAYDALGAHSVDEPELAAGLELATQLQRALVETGRLVIENRKWQALGKFTKVVLGECPALHFFLNAPMAASRLALFLSDTMRETGCKLKPMVVAVPDVLNKQHLVIAVTGSARLAGVTCNTFGNKFRKAAEDMGAEILQERFETQSIFIASSDLSVFFTHLLNAL
jgi:cell division control protein 45